MTSTTIQDRIRWILEHREIKASVLSRKAGLSPSHVGLILSGSIKGMLQPETVEALAKAGRVSYEWLGTGKGSPDASEPPAGITVVRDVGTDVEQDETMSDVDVALFRAMDPGKFLPADFDAARVALRQSYRKTNGADLGTIGKRALEAAKALRLAGETPTTVAILSRLAFGRT